METMEAIERSEFIVNLLKDNYDVIECNIGEPGYGNEKSALICYDWDEIEEKYPNIYEYLDNSYILLYSDEWYILDNGNCYRTLADSYGWKPSIIMDCYEYITAEALNNYSDDEFLEFLKNNNYINNNKRAINLQGFEPRGLKIEEEEFHMFVNESDPSKILSDLLKNDPAGKFYFVIDLVAQFGLQYSIYKL